MSGAFYNESTSEALKEFAEDVDEYFNRLDAKQLELSIEDVAFVASVKDYYERYDELTMKQLYRLREICKEIGVY